MEKLATCIKSRRKNIDMTQRELANKMDVTVTTVSRWELGMFEPSMSDFLKLCEILAMEPGWFMKGKGEKL